ncbi:unnamed protein product, partial [Mesorhabditis belari]|uniref:Repressor of RNA polymerase III transcription MAF1 n=1 Tax=Mesorhabditis belari TaxID=2138241 RepID=A0AAF3F1N9_9BILA
MKYLENSSLQQISEKIGSASNDCLLDFKLESYSCKMIQSDKRQWKTTNLNERQPLSPPEDWSTLAAPIGHSHRMRHLSEHSCSGGSDHDGDELNYVDSISKRTMFDLIAALNTSYSDYDFSDVKSSTFSRMRDFESVVDAVDNKLSTAVGDKYRLLRDELWQSIVEEIKPLECKIYSYNSGYDGDPFSEEGVFWGLTYFFYNKNLKQRPTKGNVYMLQS